MCYFLKWLPCYRKLEAERDQYAQWYRDCQEAKATIDYNYAHIKQNGKAAQRRVLLEVQDAIFGPRL